MRREILSSSVASGLLRQHEAQIREVAFESDIVLLDVNRPDEYERASSSNFL